MITCMGRPHKESRARVCVHPSVSLRESAMEFRASSLLLFVCITFIILTDAKGGIPSCCLTASKRIKPRMLKQAIKYEIQKKSGPCEIDALVLHLVKKRICLHPKLEKRVKKFLKHKQRKNPKGK